MSGKQVRCLASIYQIRAEDLGLEAEDGHVPKKSSKTQTERKTKRRHRWHTCCVQQRSQGEVLPPEVWQRLQVPLSRWGGKGELLPSSGQRQGCFQTSCNAQSSCPQQRTIQPKTSTVPKLRNSDLKEASSNNNIEDKTSGSSLPLLTSWF